MEHLLHKKKSYHVNRYYIKRHFRLKAIPVYCIIDTIHWIKNSTEFIRTVFLVRPSYNAWNDKFGYIYFEESSLICGKMPENKDEEVVDKWVLENFMKSDSSIVRMYKKVDDLLLLIVVIFLVNIILSILTVNNIISRPPAELAVKDWFSPAFLCCISYIIYIYKFDICK